MKHAKPSATRSKKAEWAWANAAEIYRERDLLVRALSKCHPSHLMRHVRSGNPKPVVCIHTPAGKLAWTLPEGDDYAKSHYRHLEWTDNDWDGCKTAERFERLEAL